MDSASFNEMATALHELGFSSQELGNAELLAHQLQKRHGWSAAAAEFAVIRMHRRQEALAQLEQLIRRAQPFEEWVRALTKESPPPWRKIAELTWSLLWMRWKDLRRA